jgi:hypothetical protein
MALPTKANVETLDYASSEGPGVFVVAKSSIDTTTLDYADNEGPFFGVSDAGAPIAQALTATVAVVATLVKDISLVRSAAVASVASISKSLSRTLSATVAALATLVASTGPGDALLTVTSTVIASAVKQINKILIAR